MPPRYNNNSMSTARASLIGKGELETGISFNLRIESMTVKVLRALDGETLEILTEMRVPDRDDQNRTINVHSYVHADAAAAIENKASSYLVWVVREELRRMLLHELDEQFIVDGERVRDPHGIHVGSLVMIADGSGEAGQVIAIDSDAGMATVSLANCAHRRTVSLKLLKERD